MALSQPSLFLWGLQVTNANRSVDYKLVSGGPEIRATLNLGYYSLTSLMTEIQRAMSAADNSVTYSVTANRSVAGGLQNRVTIAVTGSAFFSLLFSSGTRNASSIASLIGFLPADKTGATTYTGSATAGTAFVTTYPAYNYLSPDVDKKVQGSRSISASGLKESIVFNIMQFIEAEFKYELSAKVLTDWEPFFDWAIEQKEFEFTPEYNNSSVFYPVTLEKTADDGNGMGMKWKEHLSEKMPGRFTTQGLVFRVVIAPGTFIV